MTLTGTFTAKRFETVEMQTLDRTFGGYAERVLRADLLERAIIPLLATGKEYVISFGKMVNEVRAAGPDGWPLCERSMTVTVRLALAFNAEVGDEIDRNGVPLDCSNWYLTYYWPKRRREWRLSEIGEQRVGNMVLTIESFDRVWRIGSRAYEPLMNADCSELLAWRRVA